MANDGEPTTVAEFLQSIVDKAKRNLPTGELVFANSVCDQTVRYLVTDGDGLGIFGPIRDRDALVTELILTAHAMSDHELINYDGFMKFLRDQGYRDTVISQ